MRMMKKTIYTIGRDESCDICLSDPSNFISRNHAILKICKNGKYAIIDQSLNGTYVNGVKITPGKEVPVTRKDSINFANAAYLNWSLIPKMNKPVKIAMTSIAGAAIAAGALIILFNLNTQQVSDNGKIDSTIVFSDDYRVNDNPGNSVENDGEPNFIKKLKPKKSNKTKQETEKAIVNDSTANNKTQTGDSLVTPVPALDSMVTVVEDSVVDSASLKKNIDAIY